MHTRVFGAFRPMGLFRSGIHFLSALAVACVSTAGLARPEGQQPEHKVLAAARELLQAGEFDAAAALLAELIEVEKSNARAWQLLGRAYEFLGEFELALPAYLEASKDAQVAPQAFYRAAAIHAQTAEFEAALDFLRRAENTGSVDLARVDTDPIFAALRADDRYKDLRPPAESYLDSFVEPVHVLHVFDGEAALGQFGWIARVVGDIDGDGWFDLLATAAWSSVHGSRSGRIFVLSGAP